MSDRISLKQFVTAKLVFPTHLRRQIAYYILIAFVISFLVDIYTIYSVGLPVKIGMTVFTLFLGVLPISLYFCYTVKRIVTNVKLPKGKKEKVEYWLFSKMVLHLFVLILMYFWLSILLLVALLAVLG